LSPNYYGFDWYLVMILRPWTLRSKNMKLRIIYRLTASSLIHNAEGCCDKVHQWLLDSFTLQWQASKIKFCASEAKAEGPSSRCHQ